MRLTSRVDMNIGYSCNINCNFCYYHQTVQERDKAKDLSSNEIQEQLRYIRSQAIDTVDFTGGEPTIRKELFDLVKYAKSLGFKSIALITNGLRLANMAYAEQCHAAGIDDFLLSIHGHNALIHDQLTGAPGSFDKAVNAVKNLNSLPVKVRLNCVVNGINYKYTLEMFELFHSLDIQTANFIMFNPIVQAKWHSVPELNVAYSDAAVLLKRGIDDYKDKIRKITIRYMPFCLMPGYEKYITNNAQLQYDPDEWDYLVRTTVRKGRPLTILALVGGMLIHPAKRRILSQGWHDFKREGIQTILARKNKLYGAECRRCSYRPICDGLWRRYVEWRGFDELQAFSGTRITDPQFFMRQNPNY